MDVVDQFIKTDTDNTPVKNTTVKVVNPQRPRFDPCIKTDGQSMSKPLENKSETRRCERKGTEKDVEAIESYFAEKGFNVDIYHDQPHDQIKQILNQYAVDKNDWRCFVCFILTHGSEDILYAQDE
ncbi:caspase-8-like protein, partial [Leptotrombidium deliense]